MTGVTGRAYYKKGDTYLVLIHLCNCHTLASAFSSPLNARTLQRRYPFYDAHKGEIVGFKKVGWVSKERSVCRCRNR